MDLRTYYKKIREVELGIVAPFVVVVSLETAEGGKAGTQTEVRKRVAAKLIAEGRARLASDEEGAGFHESQAESKREADALAASQRMQVTIVSQAEPRAKAFRSVKD